MEKYFEYTDKDLFAHHSRDEYPKKSSFRLHTHECCELYCFFNGKGTFKVEGTSYPMQRGDILIMRPLESHYIDIDLSKPYTRMAIQFEQNVFRSIDPDGYLQRPFHDRLLGQMNMYRESDFRNQCYRHFIQNLCTPTDNQRVHILSNLLPLLNEISIAFEKKQAERQSHMDSSPVQRIIRYINLHLSENISLESICAEVFISKSQLCRLFKSATGSTVWDYITAKRLVTARERIMAGASPTKIYTECGFNDYSAFFRQYKNKYGVSPADSHNRGPLQS